MLLLLGLLLLLLLEVEKVTVYKLFVEVHGRELKLLYLLNYFVHTLLIDNLAKFKFELVFLQFAVFEELAPPANSPSIYVFLCLLFLHELLNLLVGLNVKVKTRVLL